MRFERRFHTASTLSGPSRLPEADIPGAGRNHSRNARSPATFRVKSIIPLIN
jgi:hypothetical protein